MYGYTVTPLARSASIASSVRLADINRGGSDCIFIYMNVCIS